MRLNTWIIIFLLLLFIPITSASTFNQTLGAFTSTAHNAIGAHVKYGHTFIINGFSNINVSNINVTLASTGSLTTRANVCVLSYASNGTNISVTTATLSFCQFTANLSRITVNEAYSITITNTTGSWNTAASTVATTYPFQGPFVNVSSVILAGVQTTGSQNLEGILNFNVTYTNNAVVTLRDFYTNASISNFTIIANLSNGTVIIANTSTGTIMLPIAATDNLLANITLLNITDNGGYLNKTLTNYQINNSLNDFVQQSIITFQGIERLTGVNLSGVNFTSFYLTNTTHYMRAQAYSLNGTKVGYFNQSFSLSVTPFDINITNITNFSNAMVNITARDTLFGASILVFNISVHYPAFNITDYYSTTNGSIIFFSLNNTIMNITSSTFGYFSNSTLNTTLSGNLIVNNFTVGVTPATSLTFQFVDEETLLPVNNVTYQVFSTAASGTFNSGTTAVNLTVLPNADYEIRYGLNSTVYYPRSYYFRIPLLNITEANVTLLMINQTIGTIFQRTVVNSTSIPLVNYTLVVIRAYPTSGNNSFIYRIVAMDRTDSNGNAVFYAIANNQAYGYYLLYNFTLIFVFRPEFLTSASEQLVAQNPFNTLAGFNVVNGISSTLVYNNVSQNFIATYNDPTSSVSTICLTVQYKQGIISTQNTTCGSVPSGTIAVPASNNVTGTYYAYLVASNADASNQINQEEVTFKTTSVTRSLVGWGIFGLCVLIGATMGLFLNPIAGTVFIIASAAILGTAMLGFYLLSSVVLGCLIILSGVTIYLWRR